ncbi:MAG: hypothetical protein EOO77_02185 [Oxalobacteraceae bacterium]|nr:MAG: hypothetical protein EOO77_02185 [Oxalobacteraceae bacterium]
MVAVGVKKVVRLSRLWPGRVRPVSGTPHAAHFDTRTDPLPLRPLTAAELIAMARAARRSEAESLTAQT